MRGYHTTNGNFGNEELYREVPREMSTENKENNIYTINNQTRSCYNIEDYKKLKNNNYDFGGLGPNYSEDWVKKKDQKDKMKRYAKMVKELNEDKDRTRKKRAKPKKSEKKMSKRERALAFAKNIKKPPKMRFRSIQAKPKDEHPAFEDDHLDHLERQHRQFQEQLRNLNFN